LVSACLGTFTSRGAATTPEIRKLRRDGFIKMKNVAASAEIVLKFGFEALRNQSKVKNS
jgi:hypothetical protein